MFRNDESTKAILHALTVEHTKTEEDTEQKKPVKIIHNKSHPAINPSYKINSSRLNLFYRIAGGSRCDVFLSKWNDDPAVIKKIKCERQFEIFHRWSFCNEVEFMCNLTEANVPNVIKLIGYDIEAAALDEVYVPYHFNILMEHAANGSLKHVIQDTCKSPMHWLQRLEILKGIACGLKWIHWYDIIHRDIKSDNIVLDQNWQAKITDFGIAIHKNENNSGFTGTIYYMAPESLKRKGYSEKSDMFSFSVVACELAAYKVVTDLLPKDIFVHLESGKMHSEKTANNLCNYLLSEKRIVLPEDCPPSLAELITWGWKTHPEDRPSASEAEQALEQGLTLLR